jgi:signal transduction histidine kinase/CheY-like chemotaxis protein
MNMKATPYEQIFSQIPQSYALVFVGLVLLPRRQFLVLATIVCGTTIAHIITNYEALLPPYGSGAASVSVTNVVYLWLVSVTLSVLLDTYRKSAGEAQEKLSKHNEMLAKEVEAKARIIKEQQENLYQSQKLQAIGELAGGIAHDYNNRLTVIIAAARKILEQHPNDAYMREYASLILSSAERSAELTSQLLMFARKGSFEPRPADVHVLINEVAAFIRLSPSRSVNTVLRLDAQSSMVMGNASQIQNAILNIALNARDAMPGGGDLTMSTAVVAMDETECRNRSCEKGPGEYIGITITDTGRGMDEKTLQRIYEPFFTTKKPGEGTGMGLSVAYGTVKSHGGSISVTSKTGAGTSFTLYLPLSKTEAVPAKAPSIQPPPRGSASILFVDDDEEIRKVISAFLGDLGYKVHVCGNGREAVEWYRENWKSTGLVVLDNLMPGMTGRETFSTMRLINPHAKALIASALFPDEHNENAKEEGIVGYIQKPFVFDKLPESIAAAVDSPGTAESPEVAQRKEAN